MQHLYERIKKPMYIEFTPAQRQTFKDQLPQKRRSLFGFMFRKKKLQTQSDLDAIMSAKIPLCYFALFLLQTQSIENLFFLADEQRFQLGQLKEQDLVDVYLKEDAVLELNLPHKLKRLEECQDQLLFFQIKMHVQELVRSSYKLFKRSTVYENMPTTTGKLTKRKNDKIACDLLRQFDDTISKYNSELRNHVSFIGLLARLDMLLEHCLEGYLIHELEEM